jgi:uridylate kinase
VISGGNVFFAACRRGGTDRATADYMGMLATVINAVALQDALSGKARPPGDVGRRDSPDCRALSAAAPSPPGEGPHRHLRCGTGNPFFAHTAASLRAAEIGAEVILKARKVDSVYDADRKPTPAPNASPR